MRSITRVWVVLAGAFLLACDDETRVIDFIPPNVELFNDWEIIELLTGAGESVISEGELVLSFTAQRCPNCTEDFHYEVNSDCNRFTSVFSVLDSVTISVQPLIGIEATCTEPTNNLVIVQAFRDFTAYQIIADTLRLQSKQGAVLTTIRGS